jgi:hypothetical protein
MDNFRAKKEENSEACDMQKRKEKKQIAVDI